MPKKQKTEKIPEVKPECYHCQSSDFGVIICRGCGDAMTSIPQALTHYVAKFGPDTGSCADDGYDIVTMEFFLSSFGGQELIRSAS